MTLTVKPVNENIGGQEMHRDDLAYRVFCSMGCFFLMFWAVINKIDYFADKPTLILFNLGVCFLFDGLVLYG